MLVAHRSRVLVTAHILSPITAHQPKWAIITGKVDEELFCWLVNQRPSNTQQSGMRVWSLVELTYAAFTSYGSKQSQFVPSCVASMGR